VVFEFAEILVGSKGTCLESNGRANANRACFKVERLENDACFVVAYSESTSFVGRRNHTSKGESIDLAIKLSIKHKGINCVEKQHS
jgi:hypothetical protein